MAEEKGVGKLRFSPTIELGHILQALVMVVTLAGWGLVGYNQLSKQIDQHAAEMALFKQRLTADEAATAELRESTKASAAETRQQLGTISDKLSDLRTLVAGQGKGR